MKKSFKEFTDRNFFITDSFESNDKGICQLTFLIENTYFNEILLTEKLKYAIIRLQGSKNYWQNNQ